MNWLERLVDRSAPPAVSRASLTPPRPSIPDPDDPEEAKVEALPATPTVETAPSTTRTLPRRTPSVIERASVDPIRERSRPPAGRKEPAVAKRAAETEPARDDLPRTDVEAAPEVSRIHAPAPASAPAPPIAHPRHAAPERADDASEATIPSTRSTARDEHVRDAEAASPGPPTTRSREELRPPLQTAIPPRAAASLSIGRVVVEVVTPPTTPAVTPVPVARAGVPRRATPPLRSARGSSLRFGLGMT